MNIHYKPALCTKELLQQIKEIDDTFYDVHLDIEWYENRFLNRESVILAFDGEKLIGYCIIVPIRKKLYKAFVNGILEGDININPDMYVDKSKYYYICSAVVLSDYRGQGIGRTLKNKVMEHFKPRHWCAIAVSKGGATLMGEETKKSFKAGYAIVYYK